MEPALRNAPTSPTGVRLLSVAASLFRRRGYAGATTRELAGLLGMQSASLYHHMGRKEDLLYQLSTDALTRIKTDVEGAMAMAATPLERLRVLIRTHVATALADQDKHATMLIELRALSADRRSEVLALRDGYERLVRRTIEDAQTDGAVRDDLRPKDLAVALLSMLNWSIFWFRPTGELTAATLAEMLSTVFLEGALAAPRPAATR